MYRSVSKADNKSIREWYVSQVSSIPDMIDRSKSSEEQARQAFNLRNQFKHEAILDILNTASRTNKIVNREFGL